MTMETSNGHTFTAHGVLFRSYWVGDNGGYYVWRTDDGRYAVRKFGSAWRARVDGVTLRGEYASTKAAMWACVATKSARAAA